MIAKKFADGVEDRSFELIQPTRSSNVPPQITIEFLHNNFPGGEAYSFIVC